MKLNEVIELNGKEYTVELNRESIVRIEQYTNTQKAMEKVQKLPYQDKSELEIADNEDPFAEKINEEELENINLEREIALRKIFTRAFWIWLYPVEKLSYEKICELLNPYFDDEEKAMFIASKYKEFSDKSVEIREKYLEEQKNLKALAN